MQMTGRVALGFLSTAVLMMGPMQRVEAAVAALSGQSYSIDQTRYFATPELEQAELKTRIAEASALPSVAPDDPKALLSYLLRAESLLSQLQRHRAYLLLRASRDMDDRAAADARQPGGQRGEIRRRRRHPPVRGRRRGGDRDLR